MRTHVPAAAAPHVWSYLARVVARSHAHRWNQFDLVVVVGAVVDLIVTYLNTSLFRVFRVGRVIARIFRVLRVSRGIRLAKSIEGGCMVQAPSLRPKRLASFGRWYAHTWWWCTLRMTKHGVVHMAQGCGAWCTRCTSLCLALSTWGHYCCFCSSSTPSSVCSSSARSRYAGAGQWFMWWREVIASCQRPMLTCHGVLRVVRVCRVMAGDT